MPLLGYFLSIRVRFSPIGVWACENMDSRESPEAWKGCVSSLTSFSFIGGRRILSLSRKTGWGFANFRDRWLHYKVNNHTITKTKTKTDLSRLERKPMKGLGGPHPFIGLLILDVINRFIFGHGIIIYYLFCDPWLWKIPWHWLNALTRLTMIIAVKLRTICWKSNTTTEGSLCYSITINVFMWFVLVLQMFINIHMKITFILAVLKIHKIEKTDKLLIISFKTTTLFCTYKTPNIHCIILYCTALKYM